jgi:DNA invertase Pin-like site-specific DNA recombinase
MGQKRRQLAQATPATMIGYVRVSTEEQGRSGLGLEAQRAAIEEASLRRGWHLEAIEEDVASGTSRRQRPGLDRALERCRAGEVAGIAVAKLDRLSRSLLDFAGVVEQAQREGWNLVALDVGLDLATPNGRAMAGMLAVFAQWERDILSERTRAALAVRRAQGLQLGRPPLVSIDVLRRVRYLRRSGWSFERIAIRLNADATPAPAGGQWNRAAARRVYLRAEKLGTKLSVWRPQRGLIRRLKPRHSQHE